jgi:hypothetical protein
VKTRASLCLILVAAALPAPAPAARNSAEVHPPQRRQAAVAAAEQLAQRRAVAALPADLVSPFFPPDFDKPDASEMQAAMLAAQRNAAANPAPKAAKGTIQRSGAASDRETLEKLAYQIVPTGSIDRGGAPHLMIGGKFFAVGTRFTATYNKTDYELELVGIDRANFTLRYRGEQITRPIKTVR